MAARIISSDYEERLHALSSKRGAVDGLLVRMWSNPPGLVEVPEVPNTIVGIHFGPTVEVDCSRGGLRHRGANIHGDIEIIPPNMASRWVTKDTDTCLVLTMGPALLRSVAEQDGFDPSRVEIRNCLQMRDAEIEHLGWALKHEMERGYPSGRIYLQSMATALAAALIHNYSSVARRPSVSGGGMPGKKLKTVLSFIEDNLGADLSLLEIARVAGLSASHLKVLFRKSVGISVHQYVIRRRVERAALLIREGKLPISQIAAETGFAHQSHLALHMRRVLGVSPSALKSLAS